MNDPRPPQHPFSRPPERPLIHNPNHQPSSQPPQPQQHYGTYHPPASQPQPPVHIPYSSDPYPASRRDPFLPSAAQQHTRKGSYGIQGGDAVPQGQSDRSAAAAAWGNTASHPPPSMSTSHNNPAHPPYNYDASRRRSLEAASPPSYKGPPPPPPPPSFTRPHMPPPSSPQQQQNHGSQAQISRAPFSSTFGGGRELPGLGAHRPGSSMSISSLIGGDTAANNHPTPTQSSPPVASVNGPPSSGHGMQPPSPRRVFSSGSRPDFPTYRRQPSPERHSYTPRHPEGQTYSASSPTRSYSNHGSPDHSRQSSQSYRPVVFQGSRPPASSPSDTYGREPRHSGPPIPQRPNSQPSGPGGPPEAEARAAYDNMGGRRSIYGQSSEERRRTLGESHHSRPNVSEILGGALQSSADRDRPVTVQPVSHSVFSPPRNERGAVGAQHTQPGIWRRAGPEEAQRESPELRREEHSAPFRSGYGPYSASSQPPSSYGSVAAEEMARGRSVDHLNHRVVEQYHVAPTSDPTSMDRQRAEQLTRSMSSSSFPGRSMYDPPRRMGEEMQHSKSFLGLGPESNRRTGRASPLPQAVQGAQAQPVSIGKDPNIKSEFGRMFSGLGSGLGSSTPTRQSPMPQNGNESIPPGPDGNDVRMQRVSSQNGRKPKRVKDEEGILDGDIPDGRGTPSLMGSRGPKRSKQSHPNHHHHHHAHAHHHHHHHHKPEEDLTGLTPNAPSASSTPFNNGRYSSGLPQNGAPQASHHHHHYHGTPHHHHHATRPGQPVPFEAAKVVPKVHDIQPVLDEASKLPRKHLGSQLYQANPTLPKPNSHLDDQFSYASKPKGLPRFPKNPINSTFTIRVPRYYLKPRQRQHIVLQRHLWGARIYRDDSDPVAAAIHSGWIRGEWDETVDVNMLDPRLTAPNDPKDAEETLTQIPAAPVTPPADMELHITLLILPRIQQYYGTCEYGITSHKSMNHDGLSFMIEKIKWVDEGFGERGQERGAAALKRRLDASQALLSLMNGSDGTLRAVAGTARINA